MPIDVKEIPTIKTFDKADKSKSVGKAKMDVVRLGDKAFTRLTMEPGFRCTDMVPDLKEGELCELPHLGLIQSGKVKIKMRDGEEFTLDAGSISKIPGGHDGWVIGTEPAVIIDLTGEAPPA